VHTRVKYEEENPYKIIPLKFSDNFIKKGEKLPNFVKYYKIYFVPIYLNCEFHLNFLFFPKAEQLLKLQFEIMVHI
jgi:hypothetical protein